MVNIVSYTSWSFCKMSIQVLCSFFSIGLFSNYWAVLVPYVLWILAPYHMYDLPYILPFCRLLMWLIVSLAVQTHFTLMWSHLPILTFVACACGAQKILAQVNIMELFLCFLLELSHFQSVTFNSSIHFELILVYNVSKGSKYQIEV